MRRMIPLKEVIEIKRRIDFLESEIKKADIYEVFTIEKTESQAGYPIPQLTTAEFQKIYNSFQSNKRAIILCDNHRYEVIDSDVTNNDYFTFTISYKGVGMIRYSYNQTQGVLSGLLIRYVTQ